MKTNSPPPLSPTLLAGFALRPSPFRLPLQWMANAAITLMLRKHPRAFDRLIEFNGRDVLIAPSDLPFRFLFQINHQQSTLLIIDDKNDESAIVPDATIRGPFLMLRALMEGKLDGDALFFSRDLTVEGDTEIIVALRNALDSENINLIEDVLSLFGPFSPPLRQATKIGNTLWSRMSADLEAIRSTFVFPVQKDTQKNAEQVKTLNERISGLEKQVRRLEKRATHQTASKTKKGETHE